MSKKRKLWIIMAIFLILIGSIIFLGVMNKLKWDFTKLSTNNIELNEYGIYDDFEDIKIITDTANIVFMVSEETKNLVVCNEQKNVNHSVKVKDNTLLIEVVDKRKWYEHIGINFNKSKIIIYIPKGEYGDLLIKSSTSDIEIPNDFKFENINIFESTGDINNYATVSETIKIKTTTGSVRVENMFAGMIDLSTSTGKVDINNVNCFGDVKINVSTGKTSISDTNCENLITKGSTGDISLNNVIATEKISIKRSTGDIKFKDSDANDIFVETDTGNVIGNLLTDKLFFVETDTGNIDVPKVMSDKKCEIITDTGDIKITVD